MGAFFTGACTGGGSCGDVRNVSHHGGSGGDTLRIRVIGHVTVDWEGTRRVSPLGDTEVDGADTTEEWGQDVDIPPPPL